MKALVVGNEYIFIFCVIAVLISSFIRTITHFKYMSFARFKVAH